MFVVWARLHTNNPLYRGRNSIHNSNFQTTIKNPSKEVSDMRAKIAIPDEFELKTIDDFLALIFGDISEIPEEKRDKYQHIERRIGIAKALLERLRAKKPTYVEDWLEIILEYLGDQELLDMYHEMLERLEEGETSKTKINKKLRKALLRKGYPAYKLEHDWRVVKETLLSLKIISKTSNRLNLARDYTFADGLTELIKFYSKWRSGEIP